MAVLLLAVFGYLLSAEADGGNLGRISRDWNGFVVRICQLQGELLLLPPSCCCPSKHNQRLCKRVWSIRVAQISWWQQIRATKQRAGKEQRQSRGKKKGKDWQKCEFAVWAYLESKSAGRKIRPEGAAVPLCSPPNSHCLNDHFYSQTLCRIAQVFLSCSRIIKQALCCFMYHWNVFIWRLNRQLHVFPDLGGEKQSNELTPHKQR